MESLGNHIQITGIGFGSRKADKRAEKQTAKGIRQHFTGKDNK